MAKSVLGISDQDNSIAAIWGRLIFLSCMASAVLYVVIALFACRRLILKDIRWLFIILVYFFLGAFHAFITLALLCFAVACVLNTFGAPMENGEMITYAGVMTIITIFFASGRKSILYSLWRIMMNFSAIPHIVLRGISSWTTRGIREERPPSITDCIARGSRWKAHGSCIVSVHRRHSVHPLSLALASLLCCCFCWLHVERQEKYCVSSITANVEVLKIESLRYTYIDLCTYMYARVYV